MSSVYQVYNLESEIATFFERTSATRAQCDAGAQELVPGGDIVPIEIQDVGYGYTVYAAGGPPSGPKHDFIIRFRLRSEALDLETVGLARQIYGEIVPDFSFKGQVGDGAADTDGAAAGDSAVDVVVDDGAKKEPVFAYQFPRKGGLIYAQFMLTHDMRSPEAEAWRMNLIKDMARLFAKSWNNPQHVDQSYLTQQREQNTRSLKLLLAALPERFHPSVQGCLDSINTIFSPLLPTVLVNNDLGSMNLAVDEDCHLKGLYDWFNTDLLPFGMNLNFVSRLTTEFNSPAGFVACKNHAALHEAFWEVFRQETGGSISEEAIKAIKAARVLGLLLDYGFTPKTAANSKSEVDMVPIGDDERGRYNSCYLDGLLLNESTKFT